MEKGRKIRNDGSGRVVHSSQGLVRLVANELTFAADTTEEIAVASEVVVIAGYVAELAEGHCIAVAVGTARRKAEAEEDGSCIVEGVVLAHCIDEVVGLVRCVAAVVEDSCCIVAVAEVGSCIAEEVEADYYYSSAEGRDQMLLVRVVRGLAENMLIEIYTMENDLRYQVVDAPLVGMEDSDGQGVWTWD